MNKSPAFQFYPADFMSDGNVILMSNQQIGCYMKLLCFCWTEGKIPKNLEKIAKICGETKTKMKKIMKEIEVCFIDNGDGFYIHPRLEKERKKQEEHRLAKSESGKKGAEKRWNNPDQINSNAIDSPLAKNSSSSSTSSLTTNQNQKPTNTPLPLLNIYCPNEKKFGRNKSSITPLSPPFDFLITNRPDDDIMATYEQLANNKNNDLFETQSL